MRKLKRILCVSLGALVALSATVGVLAMSNSLWFQKEGVKTDAYIFPITPKGNPEKWAEFESLQEMIDVCQVPEDILKEMSIEGLIETCLSYPMFGNMMLHNSSYVGFVTQIDRFNGLKALLNRENAGTAICDFYYNISLKEILRTDDFPIFRLRYLEYIISQPETLSQLNYEQKQELLNYTLELAKTKVNKYPETFSVMPSALIIGRIMVEDEKYKEIIENNHHVNHFLESGIDFTEETWNEMLKLLQQLGIGGIF